MNNSDNCISELPNKSLFNYTLAQDGEILKDGNNNNCHRFLYFHSDEYILHFEDGSEILPTDGAICYIAPNVEYEIEANVSEFAKNISVIMCCGVIADNFASLCNAPKTHLSVRPTVIDAFNSVAEITRDTSITLENVNRIANTFYKLFIELIFAPVHTTESKSEVIAGKIKRYIENNLDTDISVTSIAKQFYLSETHVIRIFKEKYGITPKQYLLKAKIDSSKLLLLDTSLQIKEIAMTYHFADSYHFSHTFKRFTGVSPEKFRMQGDTKK